MFSVSTQLIGSDCRTADATIGPSFKIRELNWGALRIDKMKIAKIGGFIHVVRGQRVMLDEDLAVLYGVKTKQLNQAVRRNLARFPEDFVFQLDQDEVRVLRSQIVTLETDRRGLHRKYWPYAFTEHGVAMLSSVLHSPRAIAANIEIMRAFIRLRSAVLASKELAERVYKVEQTQVAHEKELGEHAARIHDVFAAMRDMAAPRRRKRSIES